MRVRPRSSEKNAWLLSPPSRVLLFNRPEIPRKLTRPKFPSATAPGVLKAKYDQRRPFIGISLMNFWLTLLEKAGVAVETNGVELVTSTTCFPPPTRSGTE